MASNGRAGRTDGTIIGRVAATAALLAVAAAALTADPRTLRGADRELFQNGGFEDGVAGWNALDLSGGCTFESDEKVRQSGKRSLRITKAAAGRTDFLKQSARLPGGVAEVRVACAYRVDKGARLEATVYFFDAASATIGKGDVVLFGSGPTKGFEKAALRMDVPKGAVGVGVNVKMTTPGVAWVDAFTVACDGAPPGPPAIANGDFESGLDGWTPLEHGSGTAVLAADTSVRTGGRASARIARTSRRLQPEDGIASEVLFERDPGRVRVRFQARADGDARAAVVLQAFDARAVCLATARHPVRAGAAFSAGAAELAAPDGTRRVVVSLVVEGEGTAWFDDVALAGGK